MANTIKETLKKIEEDVKDTADKAASGAKKAGKAASGFLNKAQDSVVHALDVDGDGKFDYKDIKHVAADVGNKAQKTAANIKAGLDDTKRKIDEKTRAAKVAADLKALRPIFMDDINSAEFALPKLIMIVDGPDKAHKESDACKGSVGFINKVDKTDVMTFYTKGTDVLGVELDPDENGEIYYVDPADRDHYISLDDYFKYLKSARLQELQKVAQDLGAKYFDVEYLEEETETHSVGVKPQINIKPETIKKKNKKEENKNKGIAVTGENGFEANKVDTRSSRIIAKMEFLGGHPVRPTLRYLAKEKDIQGLIELRMDENHKLLNKSITIELRKSSGMSMKDVATIGAVLKGLKCSAGITFVSDAEKEFKSKFMYNIQF